MPTPTYRAGRCGSGWIALARLGQAAWFFGNLYEAVVDVPGLQADARRHRAPGVLGRGSPVRYYLPVAPLALVATTGALVGSWRSGGDRRMIGATAASLVTGAGCTAYLVRTVNVGLLRGDLPSEGSRRQQLIKTWHRWNAARLLALAGGAVAFRYACPTGRPR